MKEGQCYMNHPLKGFRPANLLLTLEPLVYQNQCHTFSFRLLYFHSSEGRTDPGFVFAQRLSLD